MTQTLKYRFSQADDLNAIKDLLIRSDLPVTDIDENKIDFIVAVNDKNAVIGCVGLERRGADGLLRSLAVDPSYRSKGIGHELFYYLLSTSRQYGIKDLHLLTTTAEKFFASSGFSVFPREEAPAPIKETAEFATICPSSSTYMVLRDIDQIASGKTLKDHQAIKQKA